MKPSRVERQGQQYAGNVFLKLLIFTFGKTWERQRSNELVITLKPPKASMEPQIAATPSLASQLVAAIVAAAQGVRDAETGTPPLNADWSKKAVHTITVTFASRLR